MWLIDEINNRPGDKKKAYSQKLKDPRWQKKRLEILNRDKWVCQFCMDDKTELHIHHFKYSGEPWEGSDSDKITACKHCHSILEAIKADINETEFSVLNIVKRPHQNRGYQSAIVLIRFSDGFKSVAFYDLEDRGVKFLYGGPLNGLMAVFNDFEKL